MLANEKEAIALTGQRDALAAGQALVKEGPRLAVVKRDVAGALAICRTMAVPGTRTIEIERAVDAGALIVGVNARNLKTLEIHPDTFSRLSPLVPPGVLRIAESGITGPADAARYAAQGADAVLVGESLVRGGDAAAGARALLAAAHDTSPR